MHIDHLVDDAARSPAPGDTPALDRIMAAIDAQPVLLRDRLCTSMPAENPPCCALGALLIYAGVPAAVILDLPNEPLGWPTEILSLMRLRYGLSIPHLEAIADSNDGNPQDVRKTRVICRVARFPGVVNRYPLLASRYIDA